MLKEIIYNNGVAVFVPLIVETGGEIADDFYLFPTLHIGVINHCITLHKRQSVPCLSGQVILYTNFNIKSNLGN